MDVSLKKLIQAAISAGLLLALSFFVDWQAVVMNLRQASPVWLALAAATVILARLAITWRWMILLRVSGGGARLRRLFGIVSAGIGVGSLIPTSVGPDIMRGALLARHSQVASGDAQVGQIVSSLLLDRIAAMFGTFLVAVLATTLTGFWSAAIPLAAVLAAGVSAFFLAIRSGPDVVSALVPERFGKLREKTRGLLQRLREPGFVRRSFPAAVAVSTLMTLARTLMFLFLYRAFGYQVPLDHALVMIPLLLIALIAPISFGGLGLREWVLVVGFQGIGIPPAVSVSVGILSFALQLVVSAPWVLAHMAGWDTQRPDVGAAKSFSER
ncbi:MAG: lysylphosphatidylglycerol synthase transmembrane domain-containing protein [Pseudomonadota bacterium]